MNKKTLIIAGVLIVIAIILFLLPRFIKKTPTTTPTDKTNQQTTTTTSATFPLNDSAVATLATQAQNEYDFAFSKAKEWKSDVTPVAAIIKYTGSIDPNNGKDTFVFTSPTLAQYYYTITISQAQSSGGENSFERVLYFKEDYFLPINTAILPVKYYKLNYLDALKKADELGGKNIRAANKNYDVNLILSAQTGSYLMWDVEYVVNNAKMFSVSMNAYDGTVSQ